MKKLLFLLPLMASSSVVGNIFGDLVSNPSPEIRCGAFIIEHESKSTAEKLALLEKKGLDFPKNTDEETKQEWTKKCKERIVGKENLREQREQEVRDGKCAVHGEEAPWGGKECCRNPNRAFDGIIRCVKTTGEDGVTRCYCGSGEIECIVNQDCRSRGNASCNKGKCEGWEGFGKKGDLTRAGWQKS